jgi:anion-transporting  ArsA/GET3 family ATPase
MAGPLRESNARFVIVTGKGGVGKTTVSATLALNLAARGKRVLVTMCNAKERLSTMLGSDLIGTEVVPVAPNIWAVNMSPEPALFEYGVMVLRSRTLSRVLFDNRYVMTFFKAVPGMQEWAMLGKAWWHTTEMDGDRPRFDVVILDAPATGHGLDMLRVPKVIVDIVPPGLLRRDAERAWNMFRDPRETSVILVTLPEELPTTETIELARTLDGELGLTVSHVVVNGVLPPLFSPEERRALQAVRPMPVHDAGEGSLRSARHRAVREQSQAESLARLAKELPEPPKTYLPLLFEDASTPRAIRELAARL